MALRRSDTISSTKRGAPRPPPPPKVVVIGEMGVGKTDLLMTGVHSLFDNDGVPFQHMTGTTIAYDFFPTQRRLTEGRTLNMILIDTAGQEKFQRLVASNYRGAAAFALVYDITDASSFIAIQQRWYPDAWQHYAHEKEKPIWFLVGTKTDLHEQREVTYEEAQLYATTIDAFLFETNTREGKGARARLTLDLIASTLVRHGVPCDAERSAAATIRDDIVALRTSASLSKRGKCAC